MFTATPLFSMLATLGVCEQAADVPADPLRTACEVDPVKQRSTYRDRVYDRPAHL